MFCVFIQLDAAVVFALRRFGFKRFKGLRIKATVGRLNLFFLRFCEIVLPSTLNSSFIFSSPDFTQ